MRRLVLLLALSMVATIGSLPIVNSAGALEEATVVASTSSTWQTNGTVRALAYANGAVYLGGEFTSVRPPGAAAGTGEVPRSHIAAFDASTGALLPFSHTLDNRPMVLTASPDGSRVYAGGDFLTVDGKSRSHLAAFDTATGALASWAPKTNGGVRGVAVHGNTVYVGGTFTTLGGSTRQNLGAAAADTGALLPWAPKADATVFRVAAAPDGTRVFVGGYFSLLNGASRRGTGSLDPVTGANEPWASANVLPSHSGTCTSDIKDVKVDQSNVYFAAEGTGGGCFDGTFAARQSDGALVWKSDCLGATQAIEVLGGFLYKGSHAHDCSKAGSFPEVVRVGSAHRHLLAQRLGDGSIGPWWPNTSGNPLGPFAMATDGKQLFVGGDFLSVNNHAQQGFTRFGGPPDLARPRQPTILKASSVTSGQVRLVWLATTDDDDEQLVYRVYRDGATTPVFTSPVVRSTFWIRPNLSFTDSGLAPGSTHTYQVDAIEAKGTNKSSKSALASATVATVNASYANTVKADVPFLYWRLGELSGTTAADSSGNSRTGGYHGSVVLGQTGAIVGDTNKAVKLATTSLTNAFVSSSSLLVGSQSYSVELWFKTTTTVGGRLVGFGNSQTGISTSYDRHVYMTNDGRLVFGEWVGAPQTIATTGHYNNGAYHHAVATFGGDGMALYVDGALAGTNTTINIAQQFNGYWRVGGDNLNNWPSKPTTRYFNGTVDEAAVYNGVLTAKQVADHFSHNHA